MVRINHDYEAKATKLELLALAAVSQMDSSQRIRLATSILMVLCDEVGEVAMTMTTTEHEYAITVKKVKDL